MSSKLPLSVLIPAKNEAANLRACLASASFADEVVVVDSGSTDGSPEMARELGAKVVDFAWNGRFPKKKNWALETLLWKHEWVFIIDADERFTPELIEAIRAALSKPELDGYYINRRFWFLDGWLHHCGYFPSWNLRLFRHRLGRYEQFVGVDDTASGDNEVHEHVVLQGKVGWLQPPMDHLAFPTISIWVEKHNRYSNWEAKLLLSEEGQAAAAQAGLHAGLERKRRQKAAARKLPFRPLLRFLYHYFYRLGFLDGYRGYVFCRLMGIYEFLNVTKAAELRRTRP